MPRINTYILKMEEGRRAQVWVVASLGVVLVLWRRSKPTKPTKPTKMEGKRQRQKLPMAERENEISRKSLEATREVKKFLSF